MNKQEGMVEETDQANQANQNNDLSNWETVKSEYEKYKKLFDEEKERQHQEAIRKDQEEHMRPILENQRVLREMRNNSIWDKVSGQFNWIKDNINPKNTDEILMLLAAIIASDDYSKAQENFEVGKEFLASKQSEKK